MFSHYSCNCSRSYDVPLRDVIDGGAPGLIRYDISIVILSIRILFLVSVWDFKITSLIMILDRIMARGKFITHHLLSRRNYQKRRCQWLLWLLIIFSRWYYYCEKWKLLEICLWSRNPKNNNHLRPSFE